MNDKPRWWWSRTRKAAWHAEQAAQREVERDRRVRIQAAFMLDSVRHAHEREARPRVSAFASMAPLRYTSGTPGATTRFRRGDGPGASDAGGWPSWGGSGTSCGSDGGASDAGGSDGGGGGGGE